MRADVLSLNGSEVASRPSVDFRSKPDEPSNEIKPVYLDEISSSVDENAGMDNGLSDCGMIPGNCLPCLANVVPSVEKRRSSSSSPPNTRKKISHKLSFKLKDGHPNTTICEYLTIPFNTVYRILMGPTITLLTSRIS